jgi:zinc protease
MRTNYLKVLLLLAIATFAAGTSSAQAGTAAASQVSEFDVNGMKVLVKRRTGAPTVAAGLYLRGGVKNLTPDTAGLEALTLNAATEGSKSYPRQKLRTETARVGTVISAGANLDFSALAFGSTRQAFENSWRIFTDVALNPAFVPADVDRVRENFLTGLRAQNDSPEGSLATLTNSIIYAGHPYAASPTGSVATIGKFKPADLAAYHTKLMQTSRLLLVIVGDIDPAAFVKELEATFGKLPRGDYKDAAPQALAFAKPSVDVTEKSVETNYVKGTFPAPSLRDPDYYAMRTAITILQQRVFEEVRGKRNLSYAPDAELEDNAANTAAISVSTTRPNEAVAVMLEEIKKLKQGSVEADQIGQMGAFFLTTYYLKQETSGAQVAELAQYELLGGGWRNSLEFLERMRRVKPEEIQAVANKYMKNIRFTIIGNTTDVDKSIFLQV